MKHPKKRRVAVDFSPMSLEVATQRGPDVQRPDSHASLDFTVEGCVGNLDDIENRRKLAIMLSARRRAALPWCPECNVHKCGEGDNLCGICSKVAAEHGPRKILELHNKYCSSCQRPLCETCKDRKAKHGGKLCGPCEDGGKEEGDE
jgi:hypothetical protein